MANGVVVDRSQCTGYPDSPQRAGRRAGGQAAEVRLIFVKPKRRDMRWQDPPTQLQLAAASAAVYRTNARDDECVGAMVRHTQGALIDGG